MTPHGKGWYEVASWCWNITILYVLVNCEADGFLDIPSFPSRVILGYSVVVVDRTFPKRSRTGSRSISRPAKGRNARTLEVLSISAGVGLLCASCTIILGYRWISMDIVYTYMFNFRYLSMHFHVYVLAHVRGQRHSHGISPVFHVLSCHTVHELRQYTQQSRQSWNLKPMRFRFVLCAFPGYLTCFYGCVYRMFQNKVKGHKVSEPWMLHSFLIASLAINLLTITTCSWNYIGWVEIQSIFNVHPGNLGKMKVFWSILTHMFLRFFQIHSWQKMHK